MSACKPVASVFIFDDPSVKGEDKTASVASVSAVRIVKCSNYIDLRDANDKTVVTLTWPDKYKVREI